MKKRIQIFFTNLLMITYALASIFGHVIVFNELLNCVTTHKQYSNKSKSHNASTIPLWTQKKHFPSSQKDDVKFYLCNNNNFAVLKLHVTGLLLLPKEIFSQSIISHSSRPRSPPYIAVS